MAKNATAPEKTHPEKGGKDRDEGAYISKHGGENTIEKENK